MYFEASVEHLVLSKLIDEGREAYLPVVDDHGVDMLVKSKEGAQAEWQELQVKSLHEGGLFAAISCPMPKPNYWFVFYVKSHDTLWLINSMDFVQLASQNSPNCKNANKYSISVSTKKGLRKAMMKYVITDFSKLP